MALSKLEQAAMDRLPEIVAATVAEGYVFAEAFDMTYAIEQGYVECNEAIHNPLNAEEVATRATAKGIEFVNGTVNTPTVNNQAEAPKSKGSTKMSFEIENI